jgi:energy-converting hydrogenase Eha subunit G
VCFLQSVNYILINSTGTDLLEKLTFPHLVNKLSPLYRTQKYMFTYSLLLALITSQTNPFHTLVICFFKMYFTCKVAMFATLRLGSIHNMTRR